MDLCVRAIIHRNLQRPPVFLRRVLPLQRRRAPLLTTFRLLAVLDVLRQPVDLLDRRCLGRNSQQHTNLLRSPRSCLL